VVIKIGSLLLLLVALMLGAPGVGLGFLASVALVEQNVLTWQDNSLDETAFHVERTEDGSAWEEIATVEPDVTTFTDDAVVIGITYCYRVKASNEVGSSDYSNVACRQVPNEDPTCTEQPEGWPLGYWHQWIRKYC
jgi:hypothetical protein